MKIKILIPLLVSMFYASCSNSEQSPKSNQTTDTINQSDSSDQVLNTKTQDTTSSRIATVPNPDGPYIFDEIAPLLQKTGNPESDEIFKWMKKTICTEESKEGKYTKDCNAFLADIPDDIMLGMEENPGEMEKAFKKKWSRKFDMNRIPPQDLYQPGNGGCRPIYITASEYLGCLANGYYYNITVGCEKNGTGNNKLIISVINKEGKYYIDKLMSQEKSDYFSSN